MGDAFDNTWKRISQYLDIVDDSTFSNAIDISDEEIISIVDSFTIEDILDTMNRYLSLDSPDVAALAVVFVGSGKSFNETMVTIQRYFQILLDI